MAHDHPLSPGGATYGILDANVLLPARLSDVLFDLHEVGLYFPRWTTDIENEFLNHWVDVSMGLYKTTLSGSKAVRLKKAHKLDALHRLNCFKSAVGIEYEIVGYDRLEVMAKVPSRVNRDDIHVVAASMVVRDMCDRFEADSSVFIVSGNTNHLAPGDLKMLGVEVIKPGKFIDRLFEADRIRVRKALERTVNDLSRPTYTRMQLSSALDLHGAKITAQHFREG